MKILFWLALRLKLKQKSLGDMYIKYHTQKVNKFLETLDLDTNNIKIIKHDKRRN